MVPQINGARHHFLITWQT